MTVTTHQLKQKEVIDQIEGQVSNKSLSISTVSPVVDFANDPRTCLTSVHLPHQGLLDQVQQDLIEPLRKIEPDLYYYANDCLHMTIKNVRVINDPPHFSEEDIQQDEKLTAGGIPDDKVYTNSQYFFSNMTLA